MYPRSHPADTNVDVWTCQAHESLLNRFPRRWRREQLVGNIADLSIVL